MGRPARTPAQVVDAAAEQEAERELIGLELRSIRPPAGACSADLRPALEAYSSAFFAELNRLRDEGAPATEVLDRMRTFRRDQHPARPA